MSQVLSTTSARLADPPRALYLKGALRANPIAADGATAARRKSGRRRRRGEAEARKRRRTEASVRIGRESRNRDAVADLGIAGLATGAALDDRIVRAVGEQGLEHREVEAMAAAEGPVGAKQRRAGERQIADGVEHLVADELVRIAQAFRVDDPVVADRDRVLERGAEREAGLPKALDVAHEAEGAGPRDLAAVGLACHRQGAPLPADDVVAEIDLDVEPEGVVGAQLREGLALRRPD